MPQDPSRERPVWPAALAPLIFEYLSVEDLVLCRRVCRQWHSQASDRLLQARCLLHSYPASHRRRWRQVLQDLEVRGALAPWLQALVAGPGPREVQAVQLACRLSGPTLLFRLVQQQVSSARFAIAAWHSVRSPRSVLEELTCSPDGRWLASCHWQGGLPESACDVMSLWRCGPADLKAVVTTPPGPPVVGLAFSLDSRSLNAMDCEGRWRRWSLDERGCWQPVPAPAPGCTAVNKATFSPDGQTLVVDSLAEVALFCKSGQDHWHKCWHRAADSARVNYWQQVLWLPVLRRPAQFSDDSQHVLLQWDGDILILQRAGNSWRTAVLDGEEPLHRPVGRALSSCSRWLALAFWSKDGKRRARWRDLDLSLGLWRFSAHQGWRQWQSRKGMTGMDVCAPDPWPLMFSPDSQYLAFPQHQGFRESQVCLLPVTGHRAGAPAVILPVRQADFALDAWLACRTMSLHFSANSRFLAAVSLMGVCLWQRDPLHSWSPVAQICNPVVGSDIRVAFSPDGFHCALTMGPTGDLAIWGPTAAGGYVRKLQTRLGARVGRLLFLPDGSRLLSSAVGLPEGGGRAAELTCLMLAPAPAVPEAEELAATDRGRPCQ